MECAFQGDNSSNPISLHIVLIGIPIDFSIRHIEMKPFMWNIIVKHTNFPFFFDFFFLGAMLLFWLWKFLDAVEFLIFFFTHSWKNLVCWYTIFFHQSLAIYQIPRKMLDTRIWRILIDGWQRLWSEYWLRTSKGVAVCDRALLFYNPIVVAQVNASLRGVNPCPYRKTISRMV